MTLGILLVLVLVNPLITQAPTILLPDEKLITANDNSVISVSSPWLPKIWASSGVLVSFYNKADTIYLLEQAADKYGISKKRFINLAFCEASLNHDQWGDLDLKYPTYGIFQFQKRTFNQYCEGNYKNESDQIFCAARLIKEGKKYLWSCPY